MVRALRDEAPDRVQDRRGVEDVAIGRRELVQAGEPLEERERQAADVPLVTAQVLVVVRQRFDRLDAPHALVAQTIGERAVLRDHVDDDPVAQRALAHHDLVAAELRERRDQDRVAGNDDVGRGAGSSPASGAARPRSSRASGAAAPRAVRA